jgi:hypothetical protein
MSNDNCAWLLSLDPAEAAALYWAICRYYQNTGDSHAFERESAVDARSVTGSDRNVSEVKGPRETRTGGDNVNAFRHRVEMVE